MLARLENVLSIPIAAVFTAHDKTYCWRMKGKERERVRVNVGQMNDTRVQILAGLAEGDRVLLIQPEGTEEEPFDQKKPEGPGRPEGRPSAGPSREAPAARPARTGHPARRPAGGRRPRR